MIVNKISNLIEEKEININNIDFRGAKLVSDLSTIKQFNEDTIKWIELILNYCDKNDIDKTKYTIREVILDTISHLEKSNEYKDKYIAGQIRWKIKNDKIIKLKKENTILKKESIHDWLTWLINQKQCHNSLSKEIENTLRTPQSSLVIWTIDIDHFKNINDTYWHPLWDEVLKKISPIINEHFRNTDTVWRLWWEEFLVILPKIDNIEAEKLFNILREKIKKELKIENINKQITVSIWVSNLLIEEKESFKVLEEGSWNKTEIVELLKKIKENLIKRSDCALYKAKKEWRDKVIFLEKNEQMTDECASKSKERSHIDNQEYIDYII